MTDASRAAALVLALAATVTVAAQQAVFRSQVDSVMVDVSVQQRGRPIADLAATDFELRDGGVVQHISDISREAAPIDVTFVVDMSGSVQGPLLDALTRAITAAGQRLRPTDRSEVVTFTHRIQQIRPLTDGGLPTSFALGSPMGQTSLLDALTLTLIAPPESGRRHMAIVFTDGLDTSSFVDGTTVVELARRSQMAVFAVALTNGSVRKPQRPAHEALFTALTTTSGGTLTVLQRDQDLSESFTKAFDEFRTSYVLRYTYDGPSRLGWHELAVRVTRRGTYDVRARQGYFAGQ